MKREFWGTFSFDPWQFSCPLGKNLCKVHHLIALIRGWEEVWQYYKVGYALLKIGILLHKTAFVLFDLLVDVQWRSFEIRRPCFFVQFFKKVLYTY